MVAGGFGEGQLNIQLGQSGIFNNFCNFGVALAYSSNIKFIFKYRMVIELEHKGEQRYMIVAHYGGSLWSAIFVLRARKVRLIWTRLATKGEVRFYDRCKNSYF